jgi:hypothetical protein
MMVRVPDGFNPMVLPDGRSPNVTVHPPMIKVGLIGPLPVQSIPGAFPIRVEVNVPLTGVPLTSFGNRTFMPEPVSSKEKTL